MAAQGCKYILAVDVTTLDDRDLTNYGDSLSGWWLLWNKINVFAAKPLKIPTQADIQLRLAFWYVCIRGNAQYMYNNMKYSIVIDPRFCPWQLALQEPGGAEAEPQLRVHPAADRQVRVEPLQPLRRDPRGRLPPRQHLLHRPQAGRHAGSRARRRPTPRRGGLLCTMLSMFEGKYRG